MAVPQWSDVTPFVLMSSTELVAKGPPALDSAQFAKDLDEVRRLGARDSKERTADQTAAAIFWVINTAVPWNAAARATAAAKGTSVAENARADEHGRCGRPHCKLGHQEKVRLLAPRDRHPHCC